jgi:U2 snRNP auxiliary factor large subunit
LNNGSITFRSLEEEQDWVQERRRKRLARPSKFDKPPTAEQAAAEAAATALGNPAASDFSGVSASNIAALPQQTRHARRLYIGNLPPYATEDEIHSFFRHSIDQALVGPPLAEDPILSVYINHERHFCFLEFKTVEMATACMAMDGLDLNGRGKVKVKRPNDYNPVQAPKVHPSAMPAIDVSRLGIINGTVDDGANKIFIGGLHYHLQDQQVVELLQAFGKVKAFHLVKQSNEIDRSKGYCFVEYSDSAVTPVAVAGLNGMDIGGKSFSFCLFLCSVFEPLFTHSLLQHPSTNRRQESDGPFGR